MQLLASKFRGLGIDVKIFNIKYQYVYAMLSCLNRPFDAVLFPWLRSNENNDYLFYVLKRNKKALLIDLHQEQISSASNLSFVLPATVFAKRHVLHLCWGDYFKQRLVQAGIEEANCFITGNIRNDFAVLRDQLPDRKEMADEYKLDANKKWVLFAENRGWASQRTPQGFADLCAEFGYDLDKLTESVRHEQKTLKAFYEELQALPDGFFDHIEFIYRPHPGTVYSTVGDDRVRILNKRQIYDWLNVCNVFVTCESTSIFEADMFGLPCYWHRSEDVGEADQMPGIRDYPRLECLSDLVSIVQLEKPREPMRIYEKYLGVIDGNSAMRTAETVAHILKNTKNEEGASKTMNFRLGKVFRYIFFDLFTRLSVGFGLLQKIKWPHTAYIEQNDIPYLNK